ncbi:transporter [Phaeodactylibacter luteus]|uniref:Transporter n=1 Tax=Phaeodactylibacter luteus TaxID=1564516 RepID=A0A5C6RK68_9BACT|nr:transporter [Phaeodactylibacter luteus]TXB62593.1 transporter [Phaeodactylibacter luteus]
MKRLFLLSLLFLGILGHGKACDACGCSMSPGYAGLLPQLGGHYIGFWWQHQQYRTFPDLSFEPGASPQTEYFNSLEVRGRWQAGRKWQLTAILPYAYHLRQEDGTPKTVSGLGDLTLMAHYALWSSPDSTYSLFRHRLSLGAGAKAPTGRFETPGPNEVANPNFQVGTGSWDALANLSYTLRYERWGLNVDATARFNGESSSTYRFGNRFSGLASVFTLRQHGRLQLMPNAGLMYEAAELDTERGYFRTQTGGRAWLANAGLEAFLGNLNLGIAWSLPLRQDWNNGLVDARQRAAVHFNVFF